MLCTYLPGILPHTAGMDDHETDIFPQQEYKQSHSQPLAYPSQDPKQEDPVRPEILFFLVH